MVWINSVNYAVLGYNTIGDYPNATGIMPMLYSIRDAIPLGFTSLTLVLFFILFAGQYFIIKNKQGRARVLIALVSSSFTTTILSMFLFLSTLITYKVLLFWAFLTMVSFIIMLLSDRF